MSRNRFKEASKATGISEHKLRYSKTLTPDETERYRAWQFGALGNCVRIPSPRPEWERIAKTTKIPVDIVSQVYWLSRQPSVHRFPDKHNPLFAEDNERWTPVWDKDKGPAPLYHLMKALADAEWLLTDAIEENGLMMEAIRASAPDDAPLAEWIEGLRDLQELVIDAWNIRIKHRGRRPLPDWTWAAAGYMRYRGCTKKDYHALLYALHPQLGVTAGAKQWSAAWEDRTIDWSNPMHALQAYQSAILLGIKRRS